MGSIYVNSLYLFLQFFGYFIFNQLNPRSTIPDSRSSFPSKLETRLPFVLVQERSEIIHWYIADSINMIKVACLVVT